jgi:DNA adenine methylase
VEPYGGAASVLIQKPPSYAEVYNDIDGEIVNVFRVIRTQPAKLTRALIWTPFSRDEYRASFEGCEDPLEMARRTIIRSFMGFGSNAINRDIVSGFRPTSNRSGTTPANDWANYPLNIRRLAARLRRVVIENKLAIEVIDQQDGPDALFYLDPTYVWASRSLVTMHGHHGYAHEMTDEDHEQLAARLHSIKGMAVLSGYHSDLYDRLYADWHYEERRALADGAAERTEVLWLNPAAVANLPQQQLFGGTFG